LQTFKKVEVKQTVADEDMLFGGDNKHENVFKRKYPPTPFNQEVLSNNDACGLAKPQ